MIGFIIRALLGGAATMIGHLAAFFSAKRAGADAKENEYLKDEVKQNEETVKQMSSEKEFADRLRADPAYRGWLCAQLSKKK